MEDVLNKRLIGQESALKAVSNAIRRGRAGIADENQPLGVFLFLGPTGVGKTETARALADFLFNSEKAMVRVDMSEYMEKYSVSKMIGSPPGYVGYEEGGQLTEQIRRRPYAVILLDEIEKANHEVFNILLQIFEDGRLTDAKGRIVSFKNTIIIMTSNVGSEYIADLRPVGFESHASQGTSGKRELIQKKIDQSLKETFKPEFLNRIDEIITFNYLGQQEIRQIVDLELTKLEKRLAKEKQVVISFSPALKEHLATAGFDPDLGARPLRRVIQREILDSLALQVVSGELTEGVRVAVEWQDSKVVFNKTSRAAKAKAKNNAKKLPKK